MTAPRLKSLVVYESIFGNTRMIAEAIGRGLQELYDVEVVEVGKAGSVPEGVDLLVVGGPIHAFGMTRESTREDARKQAAGRGKEVVSRGPGIREWLEGLPMNPGDVTAAAFDTAVKMRWFPVGSAARGEAARLRARRYQVLAAPEHFYVKDVDGPLLDGEVERAEAWARRLAVHAAGVGNSLEQA